MWVQGQDGVVLVYCSGFIISEARDCFELMGVQVGSADGICLAIYSDPLEALEEITNISAAIEDGVKIYRIGENE